MSIYVNIGSFNIVTPVQINVQVATVVGSGTVNQYAANQLALNFGSVGGGGWGNGGALNAPRGRR